jgi:geranylgeranyl diphosphate synthase, type II
MPSETILALMRELSVRGSKALEFSRNAILDEKIEYSTVREALNYYLTTWSDFTHAGLFSFACEAVGGDVEEFVPTQAGLALMAAAFDIQDDILDNSKTKNGQPTVFGKYDLDLTILLADAFLVKGFSVFYDSIEKESRRISHDIMQILKNCLFEMGNAHAMEISYRGRTDLSENECMSLVRKKAASIEADIHIAAILGGGNKKQTDALAKYGRNIGTLTTLREEFIDIFEKEELEQKILIKRLPIPLIYAMHDVKIKGKLENIIQKDVLTKKDINLLLEMTFGSISVKKLKKDMEDLVDDSLCFLQTLDDSQVSEALKSIVSSMLEDL